MDFLSIPPAGWLQIAAFFAILFLAVRPMGGYMANVFEGKRVFLTPFLAPVEKLFFLVCRVDPAQEMGWRAYAKNLVLFTLVNILLLFLVLSFQTYPEIPADLALNIAISFVTNTNWQAYAPETTVTALSQMVGLAVQNFVSASLGLSVAVALIRSLGDRTNGTLGNFWADFTRAALYILLPLSLIYALFLLFQGVPQTFGETISYFSLESREPSVLGTGPVASQLAIKELGVNGGGYYAASGAHPFENPTPVSNFVQMLAVLLIPAGLTATFGLLVGDKKQGRALFLMMFCVLLPLVLFACASENAGNPLLLNAGVSAEMGNMEGKDVRFGATSSAMWTAINGGASSGSSNASFDSMMPLTLLVPLSLIQTGQVVFGGAGTGLSGLLIYVLIAVFIASLMVGRAPDYLGKRIEKREILLASIALLTPAILTLAETALLAVLSGEGGSPHARGFSQLLYAASSAANNNGSMLAGRATDAFRETIGLGIAMLGGRMALMLCCLGIAGSLAAKDKSFSGRKKIETSSPLFIFFTLCVILILSIPAFLPALALGPINEHLRLSALALS